MTRHRRSGQRALYVAVALALWLVTTPLAQSTSTIPTPDQFFGFQLGAEGRLAPLEKIYEYFALIDKASDRDPLTSDVAVDVQEENMKGLTLAFSLLARAVGGPARCHCALLEQLARK